MKSPFPSGLQVDKLLSPSPPPCYLEARLVACVIFRLAGSFGVGGAVGGAKRIVIPQSAVLYVLHSDPRISWRQQ